MLNHFFLLFLVLLFNKVRILFYTSNIRLLPAILTDKLMICTGNAFIALCSSIDNTKSRHTSSNWTNLTSHGFLLSPMRMLLHCSGSVHSLPLEVTTCLRHSGISGGNGGDCDWHTHCSSLWENNDYSFAYIQTTYSKQQQQSDYFKRIITYTCPLHMCQCREVSFDVCGSIKDTPSYRLKSK